MCICHFLKKSWFSVGTGENMEVDTQISEKEEEDDLSLPLSILALNKTNFNLYCVCDITFMIGLLEEYVCEGIWRLKTTSKKK